MGRRDGDRGAAARSFAQSAVAALIAIYLGLHGFSLVQAGALLTVGAVGAALAAVVAGVLGDAVGRRRTLVTLSGLMALAGLLLVVSESFPVLLIAAFVGNLSGSSGEMGQVRSNRKRWRADREKALCVSQLVW